MTGRLEFGGEPGGAALPGSSPQDLPVGGAEVGVGLQPAGPALLVLAQRQLGPAARSACWRATATAPAPTQLSPLAGAGEASPALTVAVAAGGELLQGLVGLDPPCGRR